MPVFMRKMELADVEQVYAIEKAVSYEAWSERLFIDCIQVGYSCWVCEKNGQIKGYGLLSSAVGESHILNLAIKPDVQGQGLGRKMMEHLIRQARELNADMVYLEVRESNLPAINLYKQLSFIEIGNRKGYYARGNGREDAIVLALGL